MEFNSQICTTRKQSERLLALGLKKETADCCWSFNIGVYDESRRYTLVLVPYCYALGFVAFMIMCLIMWIKKL